MGWSGENVYNFSQKGIKNEMEPKNSSWIHLRNIKS
jgi:hypothetical protein